MVSYSSCCYLTSNPPYNNDENRTLLLGETEQVNPTFRKEGKTSKTEYNGLRRGQTVMLITPIDSVLSPTPCHHEAFEFDTLGLGHQSVPRAAQAPVRFRRRTGGVCGAERMEGAR
jgi:hypothetical protein